MNRKANTIIKRVIVFFLAFVVVTGIVMNHSADRTLYATALPDEETLEAETSENGPVVETVELTIPDSTDGEAGEAEANQETAVIETAETGNAREDAEAEPSEEPALEPESEPEEPAASETPEEPAAPADTETPSETESIEEPEPQETADPGTQQETDEEQTSPEETAPAETQKVAEQEAGTPASSGQADAGEETGEDAKKDTAKDTVKEAEYVTELRTTAADGAVIVITAPYGAIPAGAYVNAVIVSSASAQKAIDRMLGDDTQIVDIVAYDITIYDKDGHEIQPGASVSVTITGAQVDSGEGTQVYHVEDSGAIEKVAETDDAAQIAFGASHFSEYVVVTTGSSSGSGSTDTGAYTLAPGGTLQLSAPSGYSKYTTQWVSSDKSVATVSSSG